MKVNLVIKFGYILALAKPNNVYSQEAIGYVQCPQDLENYADTAYMSAKVHIDLVTSIEGHPIFPF